MYNEVLIVTRIFTFLYMSEGFYIQYYSHLHIYTNKYDSGNYIFFYYFVFHSFENHDIIMSLIFWRSDQSPVLYTTYDSCQRCLYLCRRGSEGADRRYWYGPHFPVFQVMWSRIPKWLWKSLRRCRLLQTYHFSIEKLNCEFCELNAQGQCCR